MRLINKEGISLPNKEGIRKQYRKLTSGQTATQNEEID